MRFGVIFTVGMCIALVAVMGWAIYNSVMLPDVYYSYSTKECVRVENYMPDHNFDCDNLPFRFYHIWVE